MRNSKRKTVERHFSIRCIERLGYVPNEKDLIKAIHTGKLENYDRQSNRITRWKWTDPIKNIPCVLVYDKERHQIVTVLFEGNMR